MSDKPTWRDVQKSRIDPTQAALDAWRSSKCDYDFDKMMDAISAYEEAELIFRQCDEPGCIKEGSCGWPVPIGGYRRTCYEHWDTKPTGLMADRK